MLSKPLSFFVSRGVKYTIHHCKIDLGIDLSSTINLAID